MLDNGRMIDLHTYGTGSSYAYGINNVGQVVGVCNSGGPSCGFLWDGGSTTTYSPLTVNYAANDAGQIVGVNVGTPDSAVLRAGLSTAYLPSLGSFGSTAKDINNRGQILGYSYVSDTVKHAVLWENGQARDLHETSSLPSGWVLSDGWATNDSGRIVGTADLPDGTWHGYVWQDGVAEDLGTFMQDSNAYDINNHGQIVGSVLTPGGPLGAAVLWENGVLVNLNDLLPADAGLRLLTAYAINDAGQIVGGAYVNGMEHAYLLTPVPEPATLLILAVGVLSWGYPKRSESNRVIV